MDKPTSGCTQLDDESAMIHRHTARDRARAFFPLFLALLFSLVVVLLITRFRGQVENLKGYGYLGAFVVGFLGNATVIFPAPSLAVTAALGGVLNPIMVGVAAGAGEALGEMTGYLAGISGAAMIENHSHYHAIRGYMDRYGGWVFFFLAAVPNPFFDIAGIAAGVVRFPIWKFLLSAFFGKTLKAIFFAGAGRQLLTQTLSRLVLLIGLE